MPHRPNINNYARRLVPKPGEPDFMFFRSEDGLPDEVEENPTHWSIYDLPASYWSRPFVRAGEDADARYARVHRVTNYRDPLPPMQSVAKSLDSPYRKPSSVDK